MNPSEYYNTTHLTGIELQTEIEKAKSLKQKALLVFKNYKPKLSASEVFILIKTNSPITSVRRAITNLKKSKILKKLKEKKVGIYGAKEHYYQLLT